MESSQTQIPPPDQEFATGDPEPADEHQSEALEQVDSPSVENTKPSSMESMKPSTLAPKPKADDTGHSPKRSKKQKKSTKTENDVTLEPSMQYQQRKDDSMSEDVLTKTREMFDARIAELEPFLEEHQRLQKARAALDEALPAKRGPGRPRGSTSTGGSTTTRVRKRRRRASGGTRAEEFAECIRQNPDITVSKAAQMLGMDEPNYLYRVATDLINQGVLRKNANKTYRIADTHTGSLPEPVVA